MRCDEDLPLVQRALNRFKDEGLVVIALGFQDSKANIERSVNKANRPDIIHVYDEGNKVAKAYDIGYVAASVFIDKKGNISKTFPAGFTETLFLKEIYRVLN